MIKNRNIDYPLNHLLSLDLERRNIITKNQKLKEQKNQISENIATLKKQGKKADNMIIKMKQISDDIMNLNSSTRKINSDFHNLIMRLPNIPDISVPLGKDSNENVEIKKYGDIKKFEFKPKNHLDLCLNLDLIDIPRAAKVSGSRFYYLKNELVTLNYALIKFSLDFLNNKGFNLIQPPYMLNRKAMEGGVIISDFSDVIYKIENEDLYMIATSEHALLSMHMDEILTSKDLPIRYAGISPCFRKEAGSHGKDTKGIFRTHQFEKIEQFIFCTPESSSLEFELLLKNSEELMQILGIPYRIMFLCTGDIGNVSSKTYDIEGWFPSQEKYRELVSCSNCSDYQSRNLAIRYREKPNDDTQFVHTLNSTLLATERTMISIIEHYQNKDGTINIPKVLQPYMNGIRELNKK